VEELPVIAEALNAGELSITNLDKAQSFIKAYEKKNNEVLNTKRETRTHRKYQKQNYT
jgi:hypothetical protein